MAERYWAMRTHFERREEVILPSLDEGELRQGWGSREEQDLEVIGGLVHEGGIAALTDEQKDTWRGNQRLWPSDPDPVRPGHIIVTPKLPEASQLSIVRVTGTYRYAPNPDWEDYGHIIPVEVLRRGIPYSNRHIQAGLLASHPRSLLEPRPSGGGDRCLARAHRGGDGQPRYRCREASRHSRGDHRGATRATVESLSGQPARGPGRSSPPRGVRRGCRGQDGRSRRAGRRLSHRVSRPLRSPSPNRRPTQSLEGQGARSACARSAREGRHGLLAHRRSDPLDHRRRRGRGVATSRDDLAERLGCPVRFVDGATLAALFLAHLPDIAVR